MIHRTIVTGLVWNERGELLFCKMRPDRGVFPGQWGFPGGGIEAGEQMVDALRRELREEIGIEVDHIQPAFFKDGVFDKLLPDGSVQPMYLIFLVFHCRAASEVLQVNEEFSEYRWVKAQDWLSLDLNAVTKDTLARIRPRTGPHSIE
jgi:nucleoside triphosphatase